MKMNSQKPMQKQTTFRNRKAIVPKPPITKREGAFSRIARLFQSRRPKAETAAKGPIQSRDLLALRRSWEDGKEANRVLERRISIYFSSLAKAQRMDTVLWARDFQRFLDSSVIPDSSSSAPALLQKIRIISSCEEAILAFSARCARKAESAQLKENAQKDIPSIVELKEFLEQVSAFMKEGALEKVRDDISIMADAISSIRREQGPRRAIVPEEPGPAPKDSPAMAG
jgi:hypothetical protein